MKVSDNQKYGKDATEETFATFEKEEGVAEADEKAAAAEDTC